MSKFCSSRAAAAIVAVVSLTASATDLLAAPKKAHPSAHVAQVTPTPANGAADVPLPVPAPARSSSNDPAAANPAASSEQQIALRGSDVLGSGSSIFMADVLVGEKLKELVAKRLDRYVTQRRDREGVAAFYRENGYTPIWIGNGAPNQRTMAVINMMRSADADGLDPASYHIPDFRATGGSPEKLAEAELRFTDAALTYARHAQAGRFGAQRVTMELEVTQMLPDAAVVLRKISQVSDAAGALNGYNPPFAEYKALKAKLAELRRGGAADTSTVVKIADGGVLKKGMKDPRVPALRARLKVAGDARDLTYDNKLFDAVRNFQKANGLKPAGVIGPATIAAFNGSAGLSRGDKVNAVIATMERWRWLPRNLGAVHVMVNIPDYTLEVVNHGKTVWTTRVVVGKSDTPTPLISAEIATMQLNPTWHVPESIIYNEYLPALQRDPRVLQRMGLVLERAADGRLTVKQPPGEENALGRIKFNFPNRFQVYLHDTPTRHLFARARRAYSHGCMRVENPTKFGEVLLSIANPKDNYTEERLRQAEGGEETWIKLRRKIPVHLVYMSAFVDDQGQLVVRDDIYDMDKKVTAILKGDDRRLAESYVVPAQKPVVIDDEKRRQLERYVDSPGNNNPRAFGAFFEKLFH